MERHNREAKAMFPKSSYNMEAFVANIRKMPSDKANFLNMIKKCIAKPPPHLGSKIHKIIRFQMTSITNLALQYF